MSVLHKYHMPSIRRQGQKSKNSLLKNIFIVTIIVGFFSSGILILWASTLKIPDLQSFEQRKIRQSTKIYDRTGEILLYDIHKNVQRTVIPLADISRHIKNATVAIEDAEYYEHHGVRPLATLRAVFLQPLRGKGVQGGSTITQQVVKNSILTSERKISRKLKEWILALKLEQKLTKEDILELYLNESPYGGNLYGVEEASQAFFGKPALKLSLVESAYLAALPQAPTYYSPYGNHKDKLEERKNLVLLEMFENNFITEEEYESAVSSRMIAISQPTNDAADTEGTELKKITEKTDTGKKVEADAFFRPQQNIGIKAPHFVFFIREYLEEKYGKRAIEEEGFKVITTLDWELQKRAEEIVLSFAIENEEKFNAENAGLVAIDPKTGQILVMVGSRNYFDENIDGNFNIALAKRQPGSAFKPFVYATAFKKGYTPETVVFDAKTQFQTTCEKDNLTHEDDSGEKNCYSPTNYDDTFRGPVTFREALAQSINIPAIKVLYLAGMADSLRTAKDLGISTLTDINQYGLTLVLGGGEVTLLDITSAYGVFGNDGVRNPPVGIMSIKNGSGEIIETFTQKPSRVLEENVARLISDILSDNNARIPAFGEYSPLYFPGKDVAVKTGTTNDHRDAWTVGYTPEIAVGAWAGNNDNSSMEKKVAGFIITPLWNAFMQEALALLQEERFTKPAQIDTSTLKPILKGMWQGGEVYTIDTISGKLATEYTPIELQEEKVIPNVHSALYWINKLDINGPFPEYPARDPQFVFWEYGIEEWLKEAALVFDTNIPTEFDDIHKPEFTPTITIVNPRRNAAYNSNNRMSVLLNHHSTNPLSKVDFFINGVFIGSTKKAPFSFSFIPSELENLQEANVLRVIGYDAVQNKGEAETIFAIRP